jgi:ATP-dependent helicase HrpA
MVHGSDHLTAYNVFAEAVSLHAYVGRVHGLPRHLFHPTVEEWATARGVLVKALEDVALGFASVYRTLEIPLPPTLPPARGGAVRGFRELVARVMPFDLVIEQATARGESVRVSRGSVCGPGAAVAGQVRYFADRFGTPRGAIEGTEIPFDLIRRLAVRGAPEVRFRDGHRHSGLVVERSTSYFGFELERSREPLTGDFPADLAIQARLAVAEALVAGRTVHPDQRAVARAVARLDELWRRSGGRVATAGPDAVASALASQLEGVGSWDEFLRTRLHLEPARFVDHETQGQLDELPSSVSLYGDRIPLHYEIERGMAVVRVRLREGKARRVRADALPKLDRPIRFTVLRGRNEILHADSLEDLEAGLGGLRAKGSDRRERDRRGRHGDRRRPRR